MSDRPAPRANRVLALVACAVAIAGIASVWAGASALLRSQAPWFAIVAALDAVLLLRLANWPRGRAAAGVAIAVTALTVIVAQYFIASARIGGVMGLRPFESFPLMTPELAWLFARTNFGAGDAACYVAALVIAWWLAR